MPRFLLCLAVCLLMVAMSNGNSSSLFAADIPEVAKQVKAIFEKHCYHCHGQNGSNEGNINYILNRDRLITNKKIAVGDPSESLLLKLVRTEEMPPDRDNDGNKIAPRPSLDEIATLRKWIEAGAPDFQPAIAPREFITNEAIFETINRDQRQAPERDRRFLRYFTITHLYNAGLSDDELQSYRVGLSKLVNSLSWDAQVRVPDPIDEEQTIFRIDLRKYKWRESTWEQIVAANPYAIACTTSAAKDAYVIAHSKVPAVRADWFVFAASRPPLYHQILSLPLEQKELERLLQVDVAESITTEQARRAGFNKSGVSINNRMIERHESSYGALWISYDNASSVGRQNFFQFPLGPGSSETLFKHDGGEVIFNLPNGLQAYLLVDGQGRRLDKAPTTIVTDTKQGDKAVVNGISCMSCHRNGMIPVKDQIRDHVQNNPNAFSRADAETILALYPKQSELDELFESDTNRFREAVLKTGSSLSKTEPVYALAGSFERELDLRTAASEVGVSPEQFLAGLNRNPSLARIFGPLRSDGGTIQRDVLVNHFADLVQELLSDSEHIGSAAIHDPDYELGLAAYYGDKRQIDRGEALTHFSKSASRGNVLAKAWLANDQWNGLLGSNVNEENGRDLYKAIFQQLLELAAAGNIDAQNHVAFNYYDGIAIAKDEAMAVTLYLKAAESGNQSTLRNVGHAYYEGRGVVQDYSEALKWFRKAAEKGQPIAMTEIGQMYYLGQGVTQDDSEALKWFRKAAEKGEPTAMTEIGNMYHHGRGVTQDDSEALKWFRKAAEIGNSSAMCNIGAMYYLGRGVSEDSIEAVRWFRKAAEKSSFAAMGWIGVAYRDGRGVDKDDEEAVRWFRVAAENGMADAMNALGVAYEGGVGIAKDGKEAVNWYRKSANLNFNYGQVNLGRAYLLGFGVTADRNEAARWLRKAAKGSDLNAANEAKDWMRKYFIFE